MAPVLSAQLREVNNQYPCREIQLHQLSCLLSQRAPSPPNLIIHGLDATCKTTITAAVLAHSGLVHAIIKCKECITGRHLLERTVAACLDAVDEETGQQIDRSPYVRTENLSALLVHLQRLLSSGSNAANKFVLVFDGIDKQRDAPHTLIPALARLSEIIPNLIVVFIVTSPSPRMLHRSGTPHVHFPSYTRSEAIHILSLRAPPLYPPTTPLPADYTPELHAADTAWLWPRFLATVWDALAKNTARDIPSFRELAEALWPQFTASIVAGTHGPRGFSKVLVARRGMFQDENVLVQRVVPRPGETGNSNGLSSKSLHTHTLPYFSAYLLCAAYLASYNPPRTDLLHFSRGSATKAKRTRNSKPLVSSTSTTTTSKSLSAANGTISSLRNPGTSAARSRRPPRRLLAASPFPLERLLAIFHAILPGPGQVPNGADVYSQVATLAGLRLLVRSGAGGAGAGGGGGGGGDALDAGARWRVNVGWEEAVTVGRGVGFEMEEFIDE